MDFGDKTVDLSALSRVTKLNNVLTRRFPSFPSIPCSQPSVFCRIHLRYHPRAHTRSLTTLIPYPRSSYPMHCNRVGGKHHPSIILHFCVSRVTKQEPSHNPEAPQSIVPLETRRVVISIEATRHKVNPRRRLQQSFQARGLGETRRRRGAASCMVVLREKPCG